MRQFSLFSLLFVIFLTLSLRAQESPEAAIRAVLDRQVADWNRGDVDRFLTGYLDSEETTFVGKTVTRGFRGVRERYRRTYSTPEKMGKLTFSEVVVRPLATGHALVTGRFQLTREAAGGGPATGLFTLVFTQTAQGWKILHDHTS